MPADRQAPESFSDLRFPLGGIDLSRAFSQQMPRAMASGDYVGTTPEGQNVRAYDPGTMRARGGQRPGLKKYISGLVGTAHLVQELNLVVGVGYTAPGPGGGNPSLPQPPATATTGATSTITFSAPVTTGNAIIVLSQGLDGYPTVTDGAGNSYSTAIFNSVAASASRIYYATNVTGGFTTVTAAFGGNVSHEVWAFEVSGLAASPTDGTGSAQGDINAGGSLGTVTTAHPPDFIFGVFGSTNATAVVTAPGWSVAVGSNPAFGILYTFQTSAVSLTPTVVWSQSTNWTSAIAAFKGA